MTLNKFQRKNVTIYKKVGSFPLNPQIESLLYYSSTLFPHLSCVGNIVG